MAKTGKSVFLLKSETPSFILTDLKPGSMYTANMRAENKFGKSEALYVPFVTKVEPIKTIAETKVKEESLNSESELLGVILGVVFMAVIVMVVIAFTTLTYRRCLDESNSMSIPDASLFPSEMETDLLPGSGTSRKDQQYPNKSPSSPFNSYQQLMPTISFDVLKKVI